MKLLHSRDSFTFFEVIISVAIISVMLAFSVSNLSNLQNRKGFVLDVENVVEAIRNAQNRSITQEDGVTWNIKFTNDSTQGSYYEIYSGDYSASSVSLMHKLGLKATFSNPAVGFSKTMSFATITGIPSIADSVTIKRTTGSEIAIINVNSLGKTSYSYETNLIGYWPGDEGSGSTAYDASPTGANEIFNASKWNQTCKSGPCTSFVVADAVIHRYLSAVNNGAFNIPEEMSLSAWIYPTGFDGSGSDHTIVAGEGSFHMYYNYDLNSVGCGREGTTPSSSKESSSSSAPLNQWTFVSCVWTDSRVNVYVNGIVNQYLEMTGGGVNSGSVFIGAQTADYQYEGLIDDIRIYNKALSDGEELNLYNSY